MEVSTVIEEAKGITLGVVGPPHPKPMLPAGGHTLHV